jgi:hypothetical protein
MTMPNLLKIPGAVLAMVLFCAAATAADKPAAPKMKEGWDRKQVKVFAYACTDGLLEPSVRDYNAAAKASGVPMPKPFPEQKFRDSAFPMCLCIAQRVAETWTLAEMGDNLLRHSQPMVEEALQGGRCKPDGLLGDILRKKKMSPN